MLLSGCRNKNQAQADAENELAYEFHYRNLDSTLLHAQRAYQLSVDYPDGKAEALNNLAFVSMARMDYPMAERRLDSLIQLTDNQVELLVADVQHMRMCQRQSRNKDFYDYRESAMLRLRRIEEESNLLDAHQKARLVYAQTEMAIVTSTYFYYVGLSEPSAKAIADINPNGEILQDTAQLLNYYYNIGSGGIIQNGTAYEIARTEMDYLLRCYFTARQKGYIYWEANSMQAMSEHLQKEQWRSQLIAGNIQAMQFVNLDNMPDSLLAGNLAQRSLDLFTAYGDVYQTAGAYRTLAECYWNVNDYPSAIICLNDALNKDTVINRAPDLVASIREQLSLAYSAIDDKPSSDYNRNIYLDMQEITRQDRQLEARAAQLDKSSSELNWMIGAVVALIIIVIGLFIFFANLRRRTDRQNPVSALLQPLERWKRENDQKLQAENERADELHEERAVMEQHVEDNKRKYIEQRAKVSMVNSITPLIDRIINESRRLLRGGEPAEIRKERYQYIVELTDQINEQNEVLTRWIQMRQGELNLKIESFPLQDIFDTVAKSKMGFQLKGISLNVEPTNAVVKADRTLTLFMINTLSDNARKFTPRGGHVDVSGKELDDCVEISIADTGCGMSPTQLEHIFDGKPLQDSTSSKDVNEGHHGFGLMNCKGIIEKYRKTSQIFSVCSIGAESEEGRGSRFFFRLPKGIAKMKRTLMLLLFLLPLSLMAAPVEDPLLVKAGHYADSAYFSNIHGTYQRTLLFADSCRECLNDFYLKHTPRGKTLMRSNDSSAQLPAEIKWFRDSLPTNYNVILDIRNESAVAALALHQWDIYTYNNKVYTQLFREHSADRTLGEYVRVMQKSESNKNVAIVILVLLLALLIPAYYLLYYRHQMHYRISVERIRNINEILLSDISAEEKLRRIETLWKDSRVYNNGQFAQLNDIVIQIEEALRKSIEVHRSQDLSLELAEDELRRSEYENARMHISNSVLDNCLSALKHETMYYPSRIRQLIDGTDGNIETIAELAGYYKELYSLLSAQAMRQMEGATRVDKVALDYLNEILKKQNGGEKPILTEQPKGPNYVSLHLAMPNLKLDDEQVTNLFTAETVDIQFLICRQIIRDIGEATNARGCGIAALKENGIVIIEIIITQKIWKSLKSS